MGQEQKEETLGFLGPLSDKHFSWSFSLSPWILKWEEEMHRILWLLHKGSPPRFRCSQGQPVVRWHHGSLTGCLPESLARSLPTQRDRHRMREKGFGLLMKETDSLN